MYFFTINLSNTHKKLLLKVECHFQYFECHKDLNHNKLIKICDKISSIQNKITKVDNCACLFNKLSIHFPYRFKV